MDALWDAIVVGAGPAGASAAYFLGERGLRVLVLEREALPRDKPCGGAVPRSALRLFPFDFEPVVESAITTVRYAWREAERTVRVPQGTVVTVRRREFDHFLISRARVEVRDRAAASGVEERGDEVVVRSADGSSWRGRVLLLAEGSTGALARGLGLRRGAAGVPTLEAQVPLSQSRSDFHEQAYFQFGALPGGYVWAFPKRDHLSVGIVAFRNRRRPLRQILGEEMARIGVALDGVRVQGHPLPVFSGRRPLGSGHVMLLGDAAGLADPFLGEGVRYALRSGKIAADVVAEGRPAEAYTQRIGQALWPSLARARQIAALFYRFRSVAYDAATRTDEATRWMAGVLSETSDYVQMSYRLPVLVLRNLFPRHHSTEGRIA